VIPIELELENFLAYRDPGPLRFAGLHVACLAGPNGAGKSSILDAITWTLWGKARSNSADELMHQGQQAMRVTLVFGQAGARYRVQRQRRAGKQGSSLLAFQAWDEKTQAWADQSGARMAETQKKIESLLRLDYETFVNSACLMQGRADEFTTKTPGQRKQVLANILGLSRWEDYEDRAKQGIVATRAEMNRLEGRLLELEAELAQREAHQVELAAAEAAAQTAAADLGAAEERWAALEQVRHDLVAAQRQIDDLSGRIRSREREVAEAEREREATEARADRAAIQAALEQARAALAALEPVQERLEEVTTAGSAAASEAARLRGVNQALGPQTEPLKARAGVLEAATEPTCPTCGQPLTEDHRRRLLDDLHRDIEERREAYKVNQGRIRELETEVQRLEAQKADLERQMKDRPAAARRVGELEAAADHAGETARRLASLQAALERWRQEVEADRGRRAELEAEAARCETALKVASLTPADIDRLRLQKRLADERVGGARQRMAALVAFEAQRLARLGERERLAADLSLLESLREAFSKRGVPAMIIETAVPEMERAANDLLSRMTDGRMHVRVETQREIKTGEVREALDILISDELGTRPYELYSGGEAFRVNFAIRIALSRMLARRAGAQLRSLFIDEGFGTQDARGREHLVAAIQSIQDDFDLILVITHIDELKDAFPARIEVTKTPQGSQFQLA
jgi:exonuclease SbcC